MTLYRRTIHGLARWMHPDPVLEQWRTDELALRRMMRAKGYGARAMGTLPKGVPTSTDPALIIEGTKA